MIKIEFDSKEYIEFIELMSKIIDYVGKKSDKKLKIMHEKIIFVIGKLQNIDITNIDEGLTTEIFQNIDKSRNEIGIIELGFRVGHYFIFDYNNGELLKDFKIHKSLKSILENNILSIFKIKEKGENKKYIIINDLLNNVDLKIEGEFAGDDLPFEENNIGDIIISRFVKYKDRWFLLKNYYFLPGKYEEYNQNIITYFKENKINMYNLELYMYSILKNNNELSDLNINYYKRILKLMKKEMTKKQLKDAIILLKDISSFSLLKLLNLIYNLNIKSKTFYDIIKYLPSYIDEFDFDKNEKIVNYFYVTKFVFFYYLKDINIKKKSKEDKDYIKELFEFWFDKKQIDGNEEIYNGLFEFILEPNNTSLNFSGL